MLSLQHLRELPPTPRLRRHLVLFAWELYFRAIADAVAGSNGDPNSSTIYLAFPDTVAITAPDSVSVVPADSYPQPVSNQPRNGLCPYAGADVATGGQARASLDDLFCCQQLWWR